MLKTKPKSKPKKRKGNLTQKRPKKEPAGVKQEFKKYALDLKPKSGKSAEHCAVTAMTLAHHGTKEAIEALKKFKKDKRAPGWIDCAVEECEQILWQDTVGRQINDAENKLRIAAEKIFTEKLIWNKDIITGALKAELTKQKVKFTYGRAAKLYYDKKIINEDKLEFVIDDVLLVGIKPSFADWLIRFKEGLEGKDLRKGDLENIEQGMFYNDDGKKLDEPRTPQESFDEFYENQFYNLLEMSQKPEGVLLDFSGEKIYGKYFSVPTESGWHTGHCSGWCEGCFEELKCETAQEFKVENDKKRYRVLKQLLKEVVEIENRIKETKRPSVDLEYKIEVAKKLKSELEEKIKQGKKKKEIKKLEQELTDWDCEIIALQSVLQFEQPNMEERSRLKSLNKMYQAIKQEVETEESKNDVEGLEVYYGKAEPKKGSEQCYHDPLCDCEQYEPLSQEEEMYGFGDEEIGVEDIPF